MQVRDVPEPPGAAARTGQSRGQQGQQEQHHELAHRLHGHYAALTPLPGPHLERGPDPPFGPALRTRPSALPGRAAPALKMAAAASPRAAPIGGRRQAEGRDWLRPAERRSRIGRPAARAGRSAAGAAGPGAALCGAGTVRAGPGGPRSPPPGDAGPGAAAPRDGGGAGKGGCATASRLLSLLSLGNFDGGYGSMGGAGPPGGYTQSPGGFGSPAGGQAEKKQVGRAGAAGGGAGPGRLWL